MNVTREIERINQRELDLNISETGSWHYDYRHSAYIFLGGIDYDLSEGDLLAVFSQFGEIVDLHLVRDKTSGKSLGYGFLAYEDQRSTILAIDNMNGYQLEKRTLRVDHADKFRRPKGQQAKEGDGQLNGNPEDDPEYDERRKQIWDYEKYSAVGAPRTELGVGQLPPFEDVAAGVASAAAIPEKAEDIKHADRVLQMLKEKQKARALKPVESGPGEGDRRRRSRSPTGRERRRSRSRSRDRR